MKKIIRSSTVALSLDVLLKGQLKYLNKSYEIIALSGNDENLETVKQRERVKTISVKMERNISIFKDLKSLVKLYRVFKLEKPQIVHSITPKAGLLSMVAAKLAGVPIRMHTFTGLVFPTSTGIMQKLLIKMDQVLCVCATNIYPEGEGVKQDLLSYKITNKPLKVLGNGNVNGIDTSYFDPKFYTIKEKQKLRIDLGIQEDDFVFVFVGRLVKDKGINELLAAFEKLSRQNSNAKLLLVGYLETELDPLSSSSLEIIETNQNVVFVGFQKDVRPYYAISDALVFPSYREGFPNVVMQAGAMGLPSIVSNINGCNEIIIENENGIIIPVKNSDAIYNAMNRFIEDEALVNSLKSNARRMIVERYEQQVVWEAILAEYRRLETKN